MENKLFVASLSFKIRDDRLKEIFETNGRKCISAKVIMDRDDRSKGFGFVEMETEEMAKEAIKELHGSNQEGRDIVVNLQKPQEPRSYTPRNNNNY